MGHCCFSSPSFFFQNLSRKSYEIKLENPGSKKKLDLARKSAKGCQPWSLLQWQKTFLFHMSTSSVVAAEARIHFQRPRIVGFRAPKKLGLQPQTEGIHWGGQSLKFDDDNVSTFFSTDVSSSESRSAGLLLSFMTQLSLVHFHRRSPNANESLSQFWGSNKGDKNCCAHTGKITEKTATQKLKFPASSLTPT